MNKFLLTLILLATVISAPSINAAAFRRTAAKAAAATFGGAAKQSYQSSSYAGGASHAAGAPYKFVPVILAPVALAALASDETVEASCDPRGFLFSDNLHYLAEHKQYDNAKKLLDGFSASQVRDVLYHYNESEASLREYNSKGATPVCLAYKNRDWRMLELFQDYGFNINEFFPAMPDQYRTWAQYGIWHTTWMRHAPLLFRAAATNDTESIKALLELGADPNAVCIKPDSFSRLFDKNALTTPLMLAVENRNLEGVSLMMRAGGNPTLQFEKGVCGEAPCEPTALHKAMPRADEKNSDQTVHYEITKELLTYESININASGYCGDTVLKDAINFGRAPLVKLLIDAGAKVYSTVFLLSPYDTEKWPKDLPLKIARVRLYDATTGLERERAQAIVNVLERAK